MIRRSQRHRRSCYRRYDLCLIRKLRWFLFTRFLIFLPAMQLLRRIMHTRNDRVADAVWHYSCVQASGDSALSIAAFFGHVDIVRLLIEAGANINHQVRCTESWVRRVLASGLRPAVIWDACLISPLIAQNLAKRSALQVALQWRHSACVFELLAAHAESLARESSQVRSAAYSAYVQS